MQNTPEDFKSEFEQGEKRISTKRLKKKNKQNLRDQNIHCRSLRRRRERGMGREVIEEWLKTSQL